MHMIAGGEQECLTISKKWPGISLGIFFNKTVNQVNMQFLARTHLLSIAQSLCGETLLHAERLEYQVWPHYVLIIMLHVLEIFSYDSNSVKLNSSNGEQSALGACPILGRLLIAFNLHIYSSSNVSLETSPTV